MSDGLWSYWNSSPPGPISHLTYMYADEFSSFLCGQPNNVRFIPAKVPDTAAEVCKKCDRIRQRLEAEP